MHVIFHRLISCAMLTASLAAYAGELRLPMPTNEALVLTIPDEWRPQTRPTLPTQPHTGRITDKEPGQFQMLVTAILPAKSDSPHPTAESVRTAVERAASNTVGKAVEPNIAVVDLALPAGKGYYFFATDKNPAPNEYKYLIQGQLAIKELVVVFTVLMNGDAKSWSDKALTALRTARRE